MITASTALWLGVLLFSVACDVGATIYLKLAADRIAGWGFFAASVAGVAVFAPSIVSFGYGIKLGPSYIATVGLWAVGVYAANAAVGILAFGEPFGVRTAIGVVAACAAVVLLRPI
jgi:multidrug transporter EmrE-like cation transporter